MHSVREKGRDKELVDRLLAFKPQRERHLPPTANSFCPRANIIGGGEQSSRLRTQRNNNASVTGTCFEPAIQYDTGYSDHASNDFLDIAIILNLSDSAPMQITTLQSNSVLMMFRS